MKKFIPLFIIMFLSACGSSVSSVPGLGLLEGKYESSPTDVEKYIFKSGGFMDVELLGKIAPGKENITYKIEGNKIILGAPFTAYAFIKNSDGTLNFVYASKVEHVVAVVHKAN